MLHSAQILQKQNQMFHQFAEVTQRFQQKLMWSNLISELILLLPPPSPFVSFSNKDVVEAAPELTVFAFAKFAAKCTLLPLLHIVQIKQ